MNVSDVSLMDPESIYSSEQTEKKWNTNKFEENPYCHSVGQRRHRM